jgi:hypothetical protein
MKPQIEEQVEKQIMANVTDSLIWSVRDCVSGVVEEFVETEVKPAVMDRLRPKKDEIIDSLCSSIPQLGGIISEAIIKKVAGSLADGYKVNKIIKDLF